ncbi:unnamed protein product, partial [Rotaria sp. Silwood1]
MTVAPILSILSALCLLVSFVSSASAEVCQPFDETSGYWDCLKRPPKWNRTGITVAGNGTRGSSNIQLASPQGISIDDQDNLYVADYGNDRVQKFVPHSNGVGITVAGGVYAGKSVGNAPNQLSSPTDVFVDSISNIFIADYENHRAQLWTVNATTGVTLAGTGVLYSDYYGVSGNKQGDVYFSLSWGIVKYSLNSSSGTLVGRISGRPVGLFVDACDNVYVAGGKNGQISKFTSGNSTEEILESKLSYPNDVTLDPYGNLYIVEKDSHSVHRLT